MRTLLITRCAPGAEPPDRDAEIAASLRQLGHEVSLLLLRERGRGLPRRGGRRAEDPSTLVIDLPAPSHRLPGAHDARIRRLVPRAIARSGLPRPDVMLLGAAGSPAVVARALSVLGGTPYVLALDERRAIEDAARGRYGELLTHCVQEASVVATTTEDLAEEVRRRYVLPDVEVLHGDAQETAGGEPAAALEPLLVRAIDRASRRRMVFHAPYALDPAPTSASRQRPNQMLRAFDEAGYRVHRINGDPFQRRLGLADLTRRVARGQQVDFLYSENSTQPNLLATSLLRGVAPLLEARLFGYSRRRGIPVGQFYRDVYWRFPEKQSSVPPLRRALMQVAYRADLAVLRCSRAHVFLPSMVMASIVPVPTSRATALPPGAAIRESPSPAGLELLYVGGVGPGHEIDECLRALSDVEEARLTMVVPHGAWQAHRERYLPLLTDRVRVVHAGAEELHELYDQASACLLLVAPNEYRRFAVPMKLYEYLGQGKPTLASRGTLAGDLVEEMGIGFTAPDTRAGIRTLLEELREDPRALERAAERVRSVRHEHTWTTRAETVAEVLLGDATA